MISSKTFKWIFLLPLMTFCFFSCKKTDNPGTNAADDYGQGVGRCLVKKSIIPNRLVVGLMDTTYFSYNSQHQVIKADDHTGNAGIWSYTKSFIYQGNQIFALKYTPSTGCTERDTIQLNSQGQTLHYRASYKYDDTTIVYNTDYTDYTYDQQGVLFSYTTGTVNHGAQSVLTTWSNGDEIKDSLVYGANIRYSYFPDKTWQIAASLNAFAYSPVLLPHSVHLLQDVIFPNTPSSYAYTFDSDGKILSSTYTYNGQKTVQTLEYTCD